MYLESLSSAVFFYFLRKYNILRGGEDDVGAGLEDILNDEKRKEKELSLYRILTGLSEKQAKSIGTKGGTIPMTVTHAFLTEKLRKKVDQTLNESKLAFIREYLARRYPSFVKLGAGTATDRLTLHEWIRFIFPFSGTAYAEALSNNAPN